MKTFAFLSHPINLKQVNNFWPITKIMPAFFIKSILKLKNFNILTLKKIKSAEGQEIQGYVIVCSVLACEMEEIINLDQELVLDEIVSASFVAEQLGAGIMGLGGHLALIADKKPMIYKHLKTPITDGSTFSAWAIFEEIFKAAQQNKIELKNSTLTIVEPANAVGSLCARKFSGYVSRMILTGQPTDRLEKLKESILALNPVGLEIEEDAAKAVRAADILINISSRNTAAFNLADLKIKSIVCDASVSKNITEEAKGKKDIIFIEGGLVKLPSGQDLGVNFGLPGHLIPASLAEAMLLTLEGRYLNYSLGENINLDKLEDIADIAVRHGFEVFKPELLT
jgi:fatty aldehyde-generating acyl-ACP reductase